MDNELENGAEHILEDRNIPRNENNILESNVVDEQEDNDLLVINTEQFKGDTLFVSDTPLTYLSRFSNGHDISMLCESCALYINIGNLLYHRAYHSALNTLRYTHPQKPTQVQSLLQRRNSLIKKLNSKATLKKPIKPDDIRKLNEAYEFLKNDLEDEYYWADQFQNKVKSSVQGVAKNCSLDFVYGIGICSNDNRMWKKDMEDVNVYIDNFGGDQNKCYLAIFDGYHGKNAAQRSANELHHLLLNEMATFSRLHLDYSNNEQQEPAALNKNIMSLCYKKYEERMKETNGDDNLNKKPTNLTFTENLKEAFRKSYHLVDILLTDGKGESSKFRWSGTSALTLVISKTQTAEGMTEHEETAENKNIMSQTEEVGFIYIANAGSSRAVLIKDNKAVCLNEVHTTKNGTERQRIKISGGDISKNKLVHGVLPVTRGLGNHGDTRLKESVIAEPHVTAVPIDREAQMLVLASHGIWEVFSEDEVADLLTKMLPDQQLSPPSRLSDSILPLLNARGELKRESPELKSGSPELKSRSPELKGGSPELKGGSPELKSRSPELKGGSPELKVGSPELKSGSPELKSGSPELKSRSPELKGGSPELKGGSPELKSRSPELKGGSPELKVGSPELKGGSPEPKRESPELKGGSPELKGGSPELKGGSPELKGGSPELKGGSPELKSGSPELKSRSPELKSLSPELKGGSPELKSLSPELKGGSPELKNLSPELKGVSSFRPESSHSGTSSVSDMGDIELSTFGDQDVTPRTSEVPQTLTGALTPTGVLTPTGAMTTGDTARLDLAKTMCEQLTHAAILAGSRSNITVMLVLLAGCGLS
ncbi:uncharacterized protein LOC131955248 [Physella acuta]|uniref:uncharacterized protein LOC131955248 n=1 Tax=Physella acuta TaxID=109671 RepID=UPI0027DD0C11|nr:uncharacterized protein LOC131955248 [Physella acuta]